MIDRVHQPKRDGPAGFVATLSPNSKAYEEGWLVRGIWSAESACARRTFTHATAELQSRARCASRLRQAMLEAANDHGLPVAAVAASFGVAWWTTQATINSAAESLPDVDSLHVAQLRVDERRYQKVRWYRDPNLSSGASRTASAPSRMSLNSAA